MVRFFIITLTLFSSKNKGIAPEKRINPLLSFVLHKILSAPQKEQFYLAFVYIFSVPLATRQKFFITCKYVFNRKERKI